MREMLIRLVAALKLYVEVRYNLEECYSGLVS